MASADEDISDIAVDFREGQNDKKQRKVNPAGKWPWPSSKIKNNIVSSPSPKVTSTPGLIPTKVRNKYLQRFFEAAMDIYFDKNKSTERATKEENFCYQKSATRVEYADKIEKRWRVIIAESRRASAKKRKEKSRKSSFESLPDTSSPNGLGGVVRALQLGRDDPAVDTLDTVEHVDTVDTVDPAFTFHTQASSNTGIEHVIESQVRLGQICKRCLTIFLIHFVLYQYQCFCILLVCF